MEDKLRECLRIVDAICADQAGEYPVGCLRVQALLREVLAEATFVEVPRDAAK